jgi:hypothetical protein
MNPIHFNQKWTISSKVTQFYNNIYMQMIVEHEEKLVL